MKKAITLILVVSLLTGGCAMKQKDKMEQWKAEIRQTEEAFANMLADKGMHAAFVAFAADDAVILRNEKLIKGKAAIDEYYNGANATGLAWTPDHIVVAASGDLASTYGTYTYTYSDQEGKQQQSTGVFHTVWKRQSDGTWKYVWD